MQQELKNSKKLLERYPRNGVFVFSLSNRLYSKRNQYVLHVEERGERDLFIASRIEKIEASVREVSKKQSKKRLSSVQWVGISGFSLKSAPEAEVRE